MGSLDVRKLWIGLAALALAGCGVLATRVNAPPRPSAASGSCAWQATSVPLAAESARINAALTSVGLTGATATASSYGENCLDANGVVRYFSATETDYELDVQAAAGASTSDVVTNAVYTLTREIKTGSAGANPRTIMVTLNGAGGPLRLRFTYAQAVGALARGLHGDALLAVLGGS